MGNLTSKEAKALSIKKWEYITACGGKNIDFILAIPELKGFDGGCGYCEYSQRKQPIRYCQICPIGGMIMEGYDCVSTGHPYNAWRYNPSKETAQAVLDLILKS